MFCRLAPICPLLLSEVCFPLLPVATLFSSTWLFIQTDSTMSFQISRYFAFTIYHRTFDMPAAFGRILHFGLSLLSTVKIFLVYHFCLA
jgi:hypothetical protein